MDQITNGAPWTYATGMRDDSLPVAAPEREQKPTFLNKSYFFAQTGPTFPVLAVGTSRNSLYGTDTFDETGRFATHTTILNNALNALGIQQMHQRVVPKDAPPPANIRLYLDLLPCAKPEYERMEDGSYKYDSAGKRIPTGQMVQGHLAYLVAAPIALGKDGEDMFGQGTIVQGTQVDEPTQTQSLRYPLLDAEYSWQGSRGDDFGLRFWAPTTKNYNGPLDGSLVSAQKVFPFRVSVVARADSESTPIIQLSLDGEPSQELTWKPGFRNRVTRKPMYLGTDFTDKYQNTRRNDGMPKVYGPIQRFKVYDENVSKILKDLTAAEVAAGSAFTDFDGSPDEEYRFNLFGGVTSDNVPYQSYEIITPTTGSFRATENSNLMFVGGGDGTLSLSMLDTLVGEEMDRYVDMADSVQDDAINPESVMIDSGFGQTVKFKLISFIGLRKDVVLYLATQAAGQKLSATDDSAVGQALMARLAQYPESEQYGTPVTRAAIMTRSGILINSEYVERLPLTHELATIMGAYMGASDGIWIPEKSPDLEKGNVFTRFSDFSQVFTPKTVRNKDWANGMMYIENYSLNEVYLPALRSVNKNDGSVLQSLINMHMGVELEKIGLQLRRKWGGKSRYTRDQFASLVERDAYATVQGRFDSRFIFDFKVTFTAADIGRGYSWTLTLKFYAPGMLTVQTLIVAAGRIDDYQATAATN